MAGPEYSISEIEAAGKKFTDLGKTADTLKTRIDSIGLDQEAFGRLSWLGLFDGCWTAYKDQTTECKTSLEQMGNAIDSFGTGLEGTAGAYREMEKAGEDVAKKIVEAIHADPVK